MSWAKMNHYELQAMRKLLMLDVKEAADHIGHVSPRSWQHWEAGRSPVPDDVEMEIYGLISQRNECIENLTDLENDLGPLKYYKTLDAFLTDYPESNLVSWRLHQSITALLFSEGGDIELNEEAPLDTDSYLHQFLTKTRPEDLEYREQEAAFNRKHPQD